LILHIVEVLGLAQETIPDHVGRIVEAELVREGVEVTKLGFDIVLAL
jgi:hypothetical protein